MSEENIKRFNESVHSLYNAIMDKPLQVLGIFNDFFGIDKVDMQGVWSEDELRSWLKVEPITLYLYRGNSNIASSDWNTYSTKSIMDLSQNEFEWALSSLTCEETISNIVYSKFRNIFILVHFQHVKITNEHDKCVDINHLWAKIKIDFKGTLSENFSLNRSEYQISHFISGFLHSHVREIPKYDFTCFQVPCTGTGPIIHTMNSLFRGFDSNLWELFCLELSKFVTVESLAGVPYRHLENIGANNINTEVNSFIVFNYISSNYTLNDIKLEEFVKYFIQGNHLKFNYVNNSYSIGMSFIEFIVLISNEFIKWYNERFNSKNNSFTFKELIEANIIKECIISDGKIYSCGFNNNDNDIKRYIGKKICTFKGKEITLNIVDLEDTSKKNKSIILNQKISLFILNQILKVLNYRYGREAISHTEHQFSSEVVYL